MAYIFMYMCSQGLTQEASKPLEYLPDKSVIVCKLSCQSCLTLFNPLDYSLPGYSVHGISQARILGQVAISDSRESS